MTRIQTINLVACVALGAGCSSIQFGPTIDGVSPNWGYNGEATPVAVLGEAFLPGMAVSGEKVSRYDRDFIVTLEGGTNQSLEGVKQVGSNQIDGIVPPGLAPGWYGLRVDTPGGETALLEDAFEVTSSRADEIEISLSRTVVPISGLAIVRMTLLDPDGGTVPESVEVQVRMVPTDTDGSGFSVSAGDLNEPLGGEGTDTFVGHLSQTGEGFVGISSAEPDDVWVEVSANIRDRFALSARELVRFEASQVVGVKVTLPEIDSYVRAGSSFPVSLALVDFAGNTVLDQPATVALTEYCLGGSLNETITFVGSATVSVTPTRACPDNRIRAFGVVEGTGIDGLSDAFEVRPGVLSELLVMSSPEQIQAGIEDVMVFAQGADAWQNPSTASLGDLVLSDEMGTLSDANGNGFFECDEVVPGTAQCTARLYIASDSRIIDVTNPDDVSGQAGPIQVEAGAGTDIDVRIEDAVVTAGDGVTVNIQIQDPFGNPLILGSVDREALLFSDNDGPVACLSNGATTEDRTYRFECEFTISGIGRQLNVLSPTMGVGGNDGPVDVLPAELEYVEATLDEWALIDGAVAGDAVAVALEGFDRFGNRVIGTEELTIDTVGGNAAPDSTVMEDGVGLVNVAVLAALRGESIWFFRDGKAVGGTDSFDVAAASPTAVTLTMEAPWALAGEPVPVHIDMVDDHGNIVYGAPETYTLSSIGGLGPEVVGEVDGSARASMLYTTAGLGDILEVDVGGFTSSIGPVDVARSCGPLGGSGLRAMGHADGRVCLPSDSYAEIDLSWSVPDFFHAIVRFDGDILYRGSDSSIEVSLGDAGGWFVDALIMDEEACGVVQDITVYAGHEGEAVGPVSLVPASEVLIAGSESATASTGVWISADQCSGDAASGAALFVRTDKGRVDGLAETVVLPSGKGLVFNLNDDGEAEVDWLMAEEATSSRSQLMVGSGDGSSQGDTEIEVHGDSLPPFVLEASPSGSFGGMFEEIEIHFSEPMLPTSGITEHLMVSSGDIAYFPEVTFDSSMTVLRAVLDSPVDSSMTTWDMVLRDSLRDSAGNRLDGDLDLLPGGDWIGQVGPTGVEPIDVIACSITSGWFQPDGDDGPGFETEFVWISVEGTETGDWWQIDVIREGGESVFRTFSPMIRPFDESLLFDGKDLNGRTLEPGRYELSVSAVDGHGNVGQGCVSSVVINQTLNPE